MSKKRLIPEITVDYLPALELLTAAASVSALWESEPFREPLPEEEKEKLRLWKEGIEAAISPFEKADLDLVFSTVTVVIFLFYQIRGHQIREGEGLITLLRAMTPEALLRGFRDVLKVDAEQGDWLRKEVIEAALEEDRARESLEFGEEATRLVRLLSAPEEFLERMIGVLDWFHHRFILPEEETVQKEIQQRIEAYEPQIRQEPEDSLDRLTGGNYASLLAGRGTVSLFIVYRALFERSILLPDDAYLVLGVGLLEQTLLPTQDEKVLAERTDELLKAISDPNRLAILRLLSQRPRYGKELAEELGIAAPTTSYHLDKLMQAKVARLELSKGRRFYYSVNPAGIKELRECLAREFLGSREA